MLSNVGGDLTPILPCTSALFWQSTLTYALPAVVALLSATAALVASRTRGTSEDVASISEVQPASERRRRPRRGDSG